MYSTRQSETFLISTSSSTCPSWWRPRWSSPRTCSLLLELTGLEDVGQPRWPFSFVVSLWWSVLLLKVKTLRLIRRQEILSLRNILAFRILQVFVFLLGRFFATYAMNVGFQYTVEVMPTCLRGQGIALVNVMSMVSQMGSPYIVYSVRVTTRPERNKSLTYFLSSPSSLRRLPSSSSPSSVSSEPSPVSSSRRPLS